MTKPLCKVPQLSLRMVREKTIRIPHARIETPVHAFEIFHRIIGDRPVEYLMAALTDGRGSITSLVTLGQGGMHGTGVTSRDVLRAVLVGQASAFILAHNHPSGDPSPSREDVEFTCKIAEASRIVQVPLLDHLIITRDGYSSIAITDEATS